MSFWQKKWEHEQNIVLFTGLLASLFAVEFTTNGQGISAPQFPQNVYFLLGFIAAGSIIYFLPPFTILKNWLLSHYFAIWSINYLGMMVMLAGFIPQEKSWALDHPTIARWGFFHLVESYPFVILLLLICWSLFCVLLKYLTVFSWEHLPKVLNHGGLFLALTAAIFGAGDRQRLIINLQLGEVNWQGHPPDYPSRKIDLPFALKLETFTVDEYDPELSFIDGAGKIVHRCGVLAANLRGTIICEFQQKNLVLQSFMSNGFSVDGKFVPTNHLGTTPVAEISIYNSKSNQLESQGRVVTGSMLIPTEYFPFNSKLRLAIMPSKVKHFASKGHFYTPEGAQGEFHLAVNHPFFLKGFHLYQYGYDEKRGKWSELSIVEAISDPWLPLAYGGMFMVLIGVICLALGNRRKNV